MSRETLTHLNLSTLIGMTDERGHAWHYREELQGDESNHYAGFVPVEDVRRRLFDWTAESAPLQYSVPATIEDMTGIDAAGNPVRVMTDDSRQVIFHSGTGHAFGIFKMGYERHQYSETLLDGTASIITPEGLAATDDVLGIGSAGLLRQGGQAWVQIERPGNVKTPEGLDFRSSILASTSHDGSLSTTFSVVNTVVVCDNTHAWALAEAKASGRQFKIKHSRYSKPKIENARDALGILVESADTFAADVAALCRIEVSNRQFGDFLDLWAPRPDEKGRAQTLADSKRDELISMYRSDHRAAPWQGTAFGVVQAVNTWEHHLKGVKGMTRAERNMSNAVTGKTKQNDLDTIAMLDKVLIDA
ncbi:hypothetical protein N806_29660 [Rhodococcus sp. P27]|nr:hypothetical protein N806_29660 [Rhodococcus sp. P27]